MRVRLYVEGGPKGAHTDGLRRFKNGFKQHLVRLDARLNAMDVSPCGSTEETIRDYARALRENRPDSTAALLVDSESAVTADSPAKHLEAKLDSTKIPRDARANVFLMVQCMESWFVADESALKACFGGQFRRSALPSNPDIEAVAKRDVLAALVAAVKPTPAGRYHKIHHGAKILAELSPDTVAQRSRHARNLHTFLRNSVQK